MDRGSWIFFRETRTFIDGTEIERLDHANMFHSFEVYRNRKDTYVSNSVYGNNLKDYFTPLFRRCDPINMQTGTNNDAYGGNEIRSMFYELITPLHACLLYTSPSPRDRTRSRMPSSA